MLSFIKWILILIVFIYGSVKAPEWHEDYLIYQTSSAVYKLTPADNPNTGGTGFVLDTPAGPRMITNAHVCELGLPDGAMMAHQNGPVQVVRILRLDPIADLCMLEPVLAGGSLSMGSKPSIGDTVAVLGHPSLDPQTFEKGRLVYKTFIQVAAGWYDEKTCVGPGTSKVDTWLGAFCVKSYMAYGSNVTIFGGNSGSPVINFYGKVVAVVFAGSTQTNKGYFVTYEDLVRFIQ